MSSNVFSFVVGNVSRYHRWRVLLEVVLLTSIFCGQPTAPVVHSACPHVPDPLDTAYRIVSPNGGETFHVGQQCTVIVESRLSGSALLNVIIGRYILSPQSGPLGKYLQGNSLLDTLIFSITDSLVPLGGGNVSSVSDSCLIKISNYQDVQIIDYSDCYFRIENP